MTVAVKRLTNRAGEPPLYLVPNILGHPIEVTRNDVIDLTSLDGHLRGHYGSILAAIDTIERNTA